MSEKSNIEWTDSTHNFWRGCTKVSPGCKNCYAEKLVTTRLGGQWGEGAPRTRSAFFNAPLDWNKKQWICDVCGRPSDRRYDHSCTGRPEDACHTDNVTWHRRRVFSLSLGDWLDPEVPAEWLADMLNVVRRCPDLTWQLVTKRPELFKARLFAAHKSLPCTAASMPVSSFIVDWVAGVAPKNIWLLASTEDQATLDQRAPVLLKIPAAVHGLSCEPLLGPLDLRGYKFDWLIAGGESGPGARPCHIEWIRSIRDQAEAANIPLFVKQLGSFCKSNAQLDPEYMARFWPSMEYEINCGGTLFKLKHKKGGDCTEWPTDLRIRQFPAQ